jgi:hypothetical protein
MMRSRREGLVTGLYFVVAIAATAAAVFVIHVAAARQRRVSEARTAAVSAHVLGTAPRVTFLDALADTLRRGPIWVILFVTAPDCRPCTRLADRVGASIAGSSGSDIELWVVGPIDGRVRAALSATGIRLRVVRPADSLVFQQRFGVDRIPYLALIDRIGVVRAVQVGYWDGLDLDRFRPENDRGG